MLMESTKTVDGDAASIAVDAAGERARTEPEPSSPLIEKIRALRHRMPLFIRLPLACVFLVLGIIGGFIPILQGWVFIVAALWLLFPNSTERLLEKIKTKFKRKRNPDSLPSE
jgi:hypothetical protein